MQYKITNEGEILREGETSSDLLPVQDLDPQLLAFYYNNVRRIVQVITVRSTRGYLSPNLLVAFELWTSRDGVAARDTVKTYTLDKVEYAETV